MRTRVINRSTVMKKTLISILLVLALVLSALMLAACESPGSEGESSSSESVSEEQSTDVSDSGNKTTTVKENGTYDSKEEVSEYLSIYKKLPKNYITKKEARKMGWNGGYLEPFAPGKTIGGDRFKNYEKKLPEKGGRKYYECDIDTLDAKKRGAKRIIYSNDGLIYYTGNHYKSFEKTPESA